METTHKRPSGDRKLTPKTDALNRSFGFLTTIPLARSERGIHILNAAVELFTREGAASFTTRRVAREAGVSLGSLQHIFRSKDQLINAMLESRLAAYDRLHQRVSAELPFNGERRLLGLVDFYVKDIWQPATRQFFFNFYALSCHSRFAADLLNQAYAFHQRLMAAYIGAARPALTENECLIIGLQVSAMIEGLMIYTAPGSQVLTMGDALGEWVKSSILKIIGPTERRVRRPTRK